MPPPLPPLQLTPEEFRDLTRLASAPDEVPTNLRRQVEVLLALTKSDTIPTVARKMKMTAPGVRKVREKGASELLRQIAEAKPPAPETRSRASAPRGKPPIKSLREFADGRQTSTYAIIEIVALVLSADVQLAVFGIYEPDPDRPSRKESSARGVRIASTIRHGFDSALSQLDGKIHWTGCPFDQHSQFLLLQLRARMDRVARIGEPFAGLGRRKIGAGWERGWRFQSFSTRPRSAAAKAFIRGVTGKSISIQQWDSASFLSRLEALLYNLRVGLNLIGLCPCIHDLLEAAQCNPSAPMVWVADAHAIRSHLQRRITTHALLAHAGYLSGLTSWLIRRIPIQDRIPYDLEKLRHRIGEDEDGNPAYLVLPNFGNVLPKDEDVEELRQRVRQERPRSNFEYAVRLRPGQPTTSARRSSSPSVPMALLSLPRQFLFPPPAIDLDHLRHLASATSGAGMVRKPNEAYLFRVPQLVEAIRFAFRQNAYGDALHALKRWKIRIESKLKPLSPDPFLSSLLSDIPDLRPAFYFAAADLENPEHSAAVSRRLRAVPLPSIAMTADGNYSQKLRDRYDEKATFRSLICEVDADFLLRYVDETNWNQLEQEAAAFSDKCRDAWFNTHWNEIQDERLLNLISPTQKSHPQYGAFVDSLLDWAYDAAPGFRPFPRILRQAVETMQRMCIAEGELVAIAVCSGQDLTQSWWAYLREYLRARLAAEMTERAELERGLSRAAPDRGRKTRTFPG